MVWFQGKQHLAHRMAYNFIKDTITKNLWVLHRCDNPSCINIDHLFLGTYQDNIDDSIVKKRHVHGISHGASKLKEIDVLIIRFLIHFFSHREVAKMYNVCKATIAHVSTRRNWKHL